MKKLWSHILQPNKLSKSERDTIERFGRDPSGKGFLPVSDILYRRGFAEEAIELLIDGVERHPEYTAARVILAKFLYERGMFVTAYHKLTESTLSLSNNLLAQSILFKLSLIVGEEVESRKILSEMKSRNIINDEVLELGKILYVEGLEPARTRLLSNYDMEQVELPRPCDSLFSKALKSKINFQYEPVDYSKFEAFHVVPLKEIFSPLETKDEQLSVHGIELDSTTLAEIYEKQHHYRKSLEIYRRLLKVSPNSDLIRRKISEITKKAEDLENGGEGLDPQVVDTMEETRVIDKKIKTLEGILDRLDNR